MTTLVMEQDGINQDATALLRTIDCAELKAENPRALRDLLLAATENGVFYLDMRSSGVMKMNRSIRHVGHLSRAIFNMPIEEKLLYDVDSMGKLKLNGYKPIGRNRGGIKGQRDGFESYAISRSTVDMLPDLAAQQHHPGPVAEHGEALRELMSTCLDMTHLILRTMSRAFHLPDEASFGSRHNSAAASSSSLDLVRLLKYPNAIGNKGAFSIPQLAHTDMGSLTFLFTASPGLQILPAGTDLWLHVPPVPGHVIVNFGDAMKILSGGKIASVLHRVVTVAGDHLEDRYSVAFLVRPEALARMEALPRLRKEEETGDEEKTPPLSCEEWVSMRFSQLRAK